MSTERPHQHDDDCRSTGGQAPRPAGDARLTGGQGARRSEVAMAGGAFALSVALTIVLVAFREPLQRLGEWSYAGAFAVMLLNSATIIFPAFGQGFVVAVAESLNPYLLAVVGGAGATLGELSGYVVGAAGNRLVRGRALYEWVDRLPRGSRGPALFVFAATPIPFDVAGLWAGATRYPLWRFLAWVFPGKVVNTLMFAFIGIVSVDWVDSWLRWLG